MRKIFTSLMATVLFTCMAVAQTTTQYNISSINPTYEAMSGYSGDDFWNVSGFNLTISPNVNKAYIVVSDASATLKYESTAGTQTFNGLKISTGNNTIIISPSDITDFVSFLSNAQKEGEGTLTLSVYGFSLLSDNSVNRELVGTTIAHASWDANMFTMNYELKSNGGSTTGPTINWTGTITEDNIFYPNKETGYTMPKDLSGEGYFVSNSSINYLTKGLIGVYPDKDTSLTNQIDTTTTDEDGNIVYICEWLNTSAFDEYFYYGGDASLGLTFYSGTYSAGGGGDQPTDYSFGDNVTLGGTGNPTSANFKSNDGFTQMSILTNSKSSVDFTFIFDGFMNLETDMTEVVTSEGYIAYNLTLDYTFGAGNTVVLTYTGSEAVNFTFNSTLATGSEAPKVDYMTSMASFYYDDDLTAPAVFFYWDNPIFAADEEAGIKGSLTVPGGKTIDVTFTLTSYYPDGENNPSIGDGPLAAYNAVILLLNEYVAEYGAGNYTVVLNAQQVMDEGGAVNKALDESFTVQAAQLAEGTLSPESEAIFAEGEEVVFTITYEGDVTENEEAEIILNAFNGAGTYQVTVESWEDAEGIVTVDGKKVIINLGKELKKGFYQIAFFEGAVLVGEDPNGFVEINFEVGSDTEGINGIGAELNGDEVIYNLQGQKVKNASKGIFIINGKKVILK